MTQHVDTPGSEEQIACVTILADEGLLQPVVDFAHRVSVQLGLDATSAGQLDLALEKVCRNVIKMAFEPDDDGRFDVKILRRPGQVVVAVEDRGLPFDYASLREGEALGEARFVNLGRRGNRVELVGRLAQSDVRDRLPEEEHHEATSAPAAAQDVPLEIRTMRPEETFELSRCVYRSYGYSYDWDDIYYPDRIQALQEADLMRSCVAVTPEGEFAGHLAVMVDSPDAPVGEGGQAVVHPRYRGHHLFPRMKAFMTERTAERGMYGIYSEATAIHPYSQKGSLGLGAKETGFLLGYIPASVSYKEIGEDREGRRGSVALMYTRANEEPHRPIYPPAAYREATLRVVEHNDLRRTVESEPDDVPSASRISVVPRPDHNIAFLRVEEPGRDLADEIRLQLRELCQHRVDGIYVDLPLSHPATARAADGLHELGFFFGGIVPEAHATGGDILRLQYLNEVVFEASDVKTASDFGQELLDLIFRQKEALER